MADVFSSQKRSAIMARIRGRENKRTELALVGILRRNKITGWRRHQPLFGRPDFVFHQQRLVLFVDGCFWHCCPKHATQPGSNRAFWMRKLQRNRARDRLVNQTLRKAGWKVVRIWQHDLTRKNEVRVVTRISKRLAL
ncbi:very short patch repair endonuclease [Sulfuricaulis limicola]|uniref:very short patch repair endonuclease n=1 Tax=Sulfuricaulis limicola TaxID=1620215 RepID=UPI000BBA7577|nr:very short patch repair endonuclease [Sulfuricaulis limicola]